MKVCRLIPLAATPMLLASLLLTPASAAPPDRAHMPEDAKWVIHLDLEALSKTNLAEEARAERPQMTQLVRRWLQDRFGINPREDLQSLTMFSNSYEEHTGAMILRADYDPAKVKAALEQRPDVQQESWGGHTLYTFSGDGLDLLATGADPAQGPERTDRQTAQQERAAQAAAGEPRQTKPMTVALIDGKTAVVASSPERAKAAVSLVRGEAGTLAEDSPLLSELDESAMAYGAAIDLDQIEQRGGIFPILSQHERAYWCVSATDNGVEGKLKLHAKSEEVAEHMKTWLEGSIAFGQVWAADSENLKKLVDNREVSRDGKVVEITGHGDTQTISAAMREVQERMEQRIQAAID